MRVVIAEFVKRWKTSPFAGVVDLPWQVTQQAAVHIAAAIRTLPAEFRVVEGVAIHPTATVERGAIVKGPAIIGPGCLIAATAYLRGGVFMDEDCIVGPGAELKTSFMFRGSKLAHFNFVGDSILGSGVNLEAGSIIANYRNEFDDKTIRIAFDDGVIETGVEKFGALLGDGVRLGANAVIAPGAVLPRNARVSRMSLVDQSPRSPSSARDASDR